jgi:hypothetical protein
MKVEAFIERRGDADAGRRTYESIEAGAEKER